MNTSRAAIVIFAAENVRRRSRVNVSSCRQPNHTSTTRASVRYRPKIARQVAIARTAWPSDGAMTGTRMKTAMTNDITRAIR